MIEKSLAKSEHIFDELFDFLRVFMTINNW